MLNHPSLNAVPTHQHQQQQYASTFDYQQQPPPPHQHQHGGDALRPTLDASATAGYYSLPYAQHAYYAPPMPSQQPPPQYAPTTMSLKRKTPGAPSGMTSSASASPVFGTQDKLCDLCYHPDPVLFSAGCGHLFHSRCVHVWPLAACPVCDAAMPHVSVIRIDMNAQIDTRSGKWTRPEEKFIDCILTEFDRSSLPLANGTPVRLVLAKLLNCSTMRLSKKFQKNALGKRTFRVTKPTKGEAAMAFDRSDHVQRQKEFSRLEAIFRHELVEQYRRENNTDDGAYVETQDLRHAVKQFWVVNFIKLAVLIGQPVHGLDVSDSKKKKLALVMIRNAQFDELLSWNRSPANTPTISPMPHLGSGSENAPWNTSSGGVVYSSSAHSQPMDPHQQQPVKKMRTPESIPRTVSSGSVDLDAPQFEIQPAPPMAVATAYEYGKTSPPRGYSPAAADHHYYAGYPRGAYGQYVIKAEKIDSVHQQQHFGQHLSASGGYSSSSSSSGGYRAMGAQAAGGSYQSSSEVPGSSHHAAHQQQQQPPQYPWDELLEGIAEPNAQVVDPSLQAWSNLHIM